ncbi:MAG: di-heme oxidoredictase family protein, partial [Pseudomonadota bacterium]
MSAGTKTGRQRTLEAGEERPGGAATARARSHNRNAFSHASGNLSFSKEFDFKIGNAMFRKLWVSSPASTRSSDGLGPLYNARSCQRCHLKDGRGHPPEANWPKDNAVSMFLRLSVPPQSEKDRARLKAGRINVIAEPTYGTQLQDLAVQGLAGEGRMHITYSERQVTLGDGETVSLRVPSYKITDLGYGPLHPQTMISPRVAPQMIGLGLLEAIPADEIMAMADPDDRDGDGISGRANRVWSSVQAKLMLGRFGWKAGSPSVLEQSADAFAGDIGISSDLVRVPHGDCTPRQTACVNAPNGESGKDPEIKRSLMRLVAFYSRNLAVPRRRNAGSANVLAGKQLFKDIGCARCHRPSYTTGASSPDANLRNQKIWPYTDLLLHDMGEGLADNRPEGRANGREWRTPPLWGIGLTKIVSGHTYFLHDGRARSIL